MWNLKWKEIPRFYLSDAEEDNVYLALCAEGPLGTFPPLGSIADCKHTRTHAPKHVVEFDHP